MGDQGSGVGSDGRRERGLLFAIRAVHSAIFLAELGSIGWLVVSGLVDRRDRSVAVAAALVAAESAVFVLNDQVCPLTPLAERHGARSGGVSDIFLPDAVARTIPVWSTALVALAATLHARGLLRRHLRGDRASGAAHLESAPPEPRASPTAPQPEPSP